MKNKRLLDIVGEIDDRHIIEAAPAEKKPSVKPMWLKWGGMAACIALVLLVGFGSFAIVAEAKEYETAVKFFDYYDMSTEGLTRTEIKAVYRDITTKSFSYSKTAEVIQSSISTDTVGGYEIIQDNPTPEDVEALWNNKNCTSGVVRVEGDQPEFVNYKYRSEYKKDNELGFEVFSKSYIEKYKGESLLWSVAVEEFKVNGCAYVSDGVLAYGRTDILPNTQDASWLIKIDTDGNVEWKQMLINELGFDEYVTSVSQNSNGSYAVFSKIGSDVYRSNFSQDGERTEMVKTGLGGYRVVNTVPFNDGYLVHVRSFQASESEKILIVSADGTVAESFSYDGEDAGYHITDVIAYNGDIYLSAYAIPKSDGTSANEVGPIIKHLYDNDLSDISDEELTPIVRDYYTAMLLVCDPSTGVPKEFYSVKGSLGGELSVNENGELLWDVESITTTTFSPFTSSFAIGGTCHVYEYTFNELGTLISEEKTGETVHFAR